MLHHHTKRVRVREFKNIISYVGNLNAIQALIRTRPFEIAQIGVILFWMYFNKAKNLFTPKIGILLIK